MRPPTRLHADKTHSLQARPSREEEARHDLGSTSLQSGGVLLVVGFLLILCAGFIAAALNQDNLASERFRQILARLYAAPPGTDASLRRDGLLDWLPLPSTTRAVEKTLEDRSALVGLLRPRFQEFLTSMLQAGNQQAVVGREGWVFFGKDLDYVNGRSFLDPEQQRLRASRDIIAPDPVAAICDFRDQLAARGIRLVLLPVPVKPCLAGHRFSKAAAAKEEPILTQNAGYETWINRMKESGVEVFETGQLLLKRMQETGEPQYLKTDTHWTPPAMEATAHALAAVVAGTLGGVASAQSRASVSVSAHGDTVGLLGLPEQQTLFPQQTVSVHPVFVANSLWKASPEAEVLLLGDSFTNIYSLEPMGWGSGAGFAEHLSAAMGRPLDVIARNSDGAFATRQALQRELAAGRDRLSGKKIVVWEFAARELAFGDWRLLSMSLGSRVNTGFYSPPKGGRVRVEGTVAKMSQIPRPGSVPYREHIVSIQLVDARPEDAQDGPLRECLVYTWSMKEQSLTPAARLRPGDRIAAVVQSWEDVAETYEKFQRSELDDPALLAEPFNWSDGIESPARLP